MDRCHRSSYCAHFYHLGHWHAGRCLPYPRPSFTSTCDPYPTHHIRVRLHYQVPTFSSLTNWPRFTKYVGSGVVITTVLIHLLPPAISKLTSPCLGAAWKSQVRTLPSSLLFFVIPILIGSRNVALPPDAYFPDVLYHLCFWDPFLSYRDSQTHEAWYQLWYVNCDFGDLPFPTNPNPFPPFFYFASS